MSWAHVMVYAGLAVLLITIVGSPVMLCWAIFVALAYFYFTWRHDRTPRQ